MEDETRHEATYGLFSPLHYLYHLSLGITSSFFCLRSFTFLPVSTSQWHQRTQTWIIHLFWPHCPYSWFPNQLSQVILKVSFWRLGNFSLLSLRPLRHIPFAHPFYSSPVYVPLILPNSISKYSQWALTTYMVLCWAFISQNLTHRARWRTHREAETVVCSQKKKKKKRILMFCSIWLFWWYKYSYKVLFQPINTI